MAWEPRGKAGRLIYRSRRAADGRVVKEYLGTGERAEKAVADVEARRKARGADRAAVAAEVERLAEVDIRTAEVVAAAAVLMDGMLYANGFHRPNFGPWRLRRGNGRHPAGGTAGGDQGRDGPGAGR